MRSCHSGLQLLAPVVLLFPPIAGRAQEPTAQPSGINITVKVVSATTGAPVAGVLLRLRTIPEASVMTDRSGRAAFLGVPKRMEGIEATHADFEPHSEVLLLASGDFNGVSLTLPLQPRGITRLSPVAVSATAPSKAPGLEGRRTAGRGHFIDRREIDRAKPRATMELLRRVPGLRVERQGSQVRVRSRRAGDCEMLMYLNGMPIYNEMAPGVRQSRGPTPVVSVVDQIPPDMLEAVEVYLGPSETPPQYSRGGANCGAILLWTRSTR
jgi:hypothetical protein